MNRKKINNIFENMYDNIEYIKKLTHFITKK